MEPPVTSLRLHDESLLRRAFDVAKRASDAGDRPFGAVLFEPRDCMDWAWRE
jgi:tRNA(Arg) A34 adenosine deaminase TadA